LENLNAHVNWTGWESLVGLFMFLVVLIGVIRFNRKNKNTSINLLFYGTALWVMLTLVFYIGKIETYSQRAAISFWEDQKGKDCYVATYDYKSYADLFYGGTVPHEENKYLDKKWLFTGDIDKPVYISCKVNAKSKLERELTDVVYLYHSNGFYFYLRNP
jgi:hypothetical protein